MAVRIGGAAKGAGAVSAPSATHRTPVQLRSIQSAVTRTSQIARSGRGFAESEQKRKAEQQQQEGPSTSSTGSLDPDAQVEALEAALSRRRKRKGRIQPQVQVQSAVVDQATGKAPTTPIGQAETLYLQVLGGYFVVLLTEGLVLAGSGFLPEDLDALVQDYLYPSFSPQMLLFLGLSSLYGLWKTGKLPGQQQM